MRPYLVWVSDRALPRMTIREPICGNLVDLVPLSTDSVGEWVRWMDDPGTTRYLYAPGERPQAAHTPASLLDWGRRILADPQRVVFGLRERADGRLVGDARLTPVGRGRARFSIMIGVGEFRGRGIGTEATAMVCRYGFGPMRLREVLLDVDPRNVAAVRAYLRVGFESEGITTMRLKRQRWRQLERGDAALYTGPPRR